jgi:hypothetical protein
LGPARSRDHLPIRRSDQVSQRLEPVWLPGLHRAGA